MRPPSALTAMFVSTMGLSCALSSDADTPIDEEVRVTTQAQQRPAPLQCRFDSGFDFFGAPTCFADRPELARTLRFEFADGRTGLLFNWTDIVEMPSVNPLGIQRVAGTCGSRDALCIIRVGAGGQQIRFRARPTVIDTNVSPSPVEMYEVTGILPPRRQLQACNFNGVSIPTGASVTAFASSYAQVCERCSYETRTCFDGVLSGSYEYAKCTPRRLQPGQQCP